jgi:hypothetical protein
LGFNGDGSFKNLSFIWTSFAEGLNSVRIFLLESSSSTLSLENCTFSGNVSTAYGQSVALIESAGGMIIIVDSLFSDVLLTTYPLFLINTINVSPVININNSEFTSIQTQGEYASLLSTELGSVSLTLEDSTITNISNNNPLNERGGVIYVMGSVGTQVIFIGNKINNITVGTGVNGGILNLVGSIDGFFLTDCNFVDVEGGNRGGCIYFGIISIGSSTLSMISNCSFSLCGSFYGGAIYIENILIYFSEVKFSGNSGLLLLLLYHYYFNYY